MKSKVIIILVVLLGGCASLHNLNPNYENIIKSNLSSGMSYEEVKIALERNIQGGVSFNEYPCREGLLIKPIVNCKLVKTHVASFRFGQHGIVCSRTEAVITLNFDLRNRLLGYKVNEWRTCL